ncbi:MAG: GxxExxY protein [Flavobacteriales bacterium]|nr:GxxExxY protein [Flavobacteriales bacterium]
MKENTLTESIIGHAIDVHKHFGPGLLENVYKECLFYNLLSAGLQVEKELALPVSYKSVNLECGYRIDLLVEKKIVVEIKSVEKLREIHFAQTLTYLKLGGFKLGLLINFNVSLLKHGINRVINGYSI